MKRDYYIRNISTALYFRLKVNDANSFNEWDDQLFKDIAIVFAKCESLEHQVAVLLEVFGRDFTPFSKVIKRVINGIEYEIGFPVENEYQKNDLGFIIQRINPHMYEPYREFLSKRPVDSKPTLRAIALAEYLKGPNLNVTPYYLKTRLQYFGLEATKDTLHKFKYGHLHVIANDAVERIGRPQNKKAYKDRINTFQSAITLLQDAPLAKQKAEAELAEFIRHFQGEFDD